ncbi:MAG: hypothetical protein RLZZ57_3004 [Pseudomonadota bacterium]|jgi:glycosyltransferase involved in cell wall biosynthesis|nr:glycosyltransferase family 1 protein [Acetobacteraceae bacterium]
MNEFWAPEAEPSRKGLIEVLSPFGPDEAIQRMKVIGLSRCLSGHFDFKRFDPDGSIPDCVMVNGLRVNFKKNEMINNALLKRVPQSVIMMFLPDLYTVTVARLKEWSEIVDVFLVATREIASQVRALTAKDVRVLEDPIDFGFVASSRKASVNLPPKLCWFGYPESYHKSMSAFESALLEMHAAREIELSIITNPEKFGETPVPNVIAYDYKSFPDLLGDFDICVSSHAPLDFSMSTFWKSENKAVLAINRGVTVVASRTPAHERLFRACGLEAFLFDDVAGLRNAIRRLSDPMERESYLDKAQDFVLQNYSIATIARKWFDLFTEARLRKQATGLRV